LEHVFNFTPLVCKILSIYENMSQFTFHLKPDHPSNFKPTRGRWICLYLQFFYFSIMLFLVITFIAIRQYFGLFDSVLANEDMRKMSKLLYSQHKNLSIFTIDTTNIYYVLKCNNLYVSLCCGRLSKKIYMGFQK